MNSNSVSASVAATTFATRARTIDHLGREQIADCPTAVSELWKNAWDAYARNVLLRIFSDEATLAVLTDDGHGMRASDLIERWLVIGTENKASDDRPTASANREGLAVRPRQGHKGIGRLSSAKLGSVLLLITKHRDEKYVAALVDWRMFENPFLNLSDVTVATGSFLEVQDVFASLPEFADTLIESVVEHPEDWRDGQRPVREEWQRYDEIWQSEHNESDSLPPSGRIVQGMKRLPFQHEHLGSWEGTGTAMLFFELDDSLKALPLTGDTDAVKEENRDRFVRTLSSFVDPYSVGQDRPEFSYRADIRTENGGSVRTKVIVGAEKSIDRAQIQDMEHQIDGTVGDDGVFRGRLKAFGTWIDGNVEFDLPSGIRIGGRVNARVGSFDLYIASMEFEPDNSTHSQSEHTRYADLAQHHSGLMIYRDGLRVLPYGREDNDFFEIESKRSKNAGRYFWNHRQMFGRIALTRARNPNLKDKAGREGFIDNTAAKTFRAILGNILDQSARRYFGSASDMRKPRLAEIRESNRAGRAAEEQKKLRARERKQFQVELERAEQSLPALYDTIDRELRSLAIQRDRDVTVALDQLAKWRSKFADNAITRPQPSGTVRLEPRYQEAMACSANVSHALAAYEDRLYEMIASHSAGQPTHIVSNQVKDAVRAVRLQVQVLKEEVDGLLREQYNVVRELAEKRVSEFRREVDASAARLATRQSDLVEVIASISNLRSEWTNENRSVFGIYVSALETVREQIDLETLASVQVEDLREAATELNRLTALAQLGIAVEIAAHDLADFDEMATSGLDSLPEDLRNSAAVSDIRLGLEGLTDQLRFLSPLRLSGDKVLRRIDGAEIETFVEKFFTLPLAQSAIEFRATARFRLMHLHERPARVFPVFVNLVNNSIYWVGTVPRPTRQILLDAVGKEVIVSDSGPGIADEDVNQIFKLFFTRKQRSGRGVGLYLARANLAAGGHSIRYKTEDDEVPLPGATFFIRFREAEFGDQNEDD